MMDLFFRLNRDVSGGAWCPLPQLSKTNSGKEWIQLNLTHTFVITGISTQGRFGNGLGVEYAEHFWLEYTHDNGKTWNKWIDKNGNHVSHGF
jgi:discoidin domain receptor family protein 2